MIYLSQFHFLYFKLELMEVIDSKMRVRADVGMKMYQRV